MKKLFKLGTRASPLAMWQANRIHSRLAKVWPDVTIEIVQIKTLGDKILDKPMVQVGGKGIFTKELETAMQEKTIDFAVHSFKDLPTVLPEGLAVVCIPERDSPFDALFSNDGQSLRDLPENPVIASGSLRRRAQIMIARPDAEVVDIRGNVNTRLQKFHDSDWHGLIMAHAAIRRMEWENKVAGALQPDEMLPAPAQGALAIEARADDEDTIELLSLIHDETTAKGVKAERSFLAELEGGCQVPIAAYATTNDQGALILEGLVSDLFGKDYIRKKKISKDDPEQLGKDLAQEILDDGGEQIIEHLKALNE